MLYVKCKLWGTEKMRDALGNSHTQNDNIQRKKYN